MNKSMWAVALVVALLVGALWLSSSKKTETVSAATTRSVALAVVGPMTGKSERVGAEMEAAVRVLVNDLNAKGGINGTAVTFKMFDDANDKAKAAEVAKEIVADPDVIAVIGHTLSSTSLAAANAYEAAGLPAITPAATTPSLTADHQTYFSTIFSDPIQGKFMAEYVELGLNSKSVITLTASGAYPENLAKSFLAHAKELGIQIPIALDVPNPLQENPEEATGLIEAVKAVVTDDTVIALFAGRSGSIDMLKTLRDAGIHNRVLGPDSTGSRRFSAAFETLPNEIANPGFYLDNVFVSVPFIADTSNSEARALLRGVQQAIGPVESWVAPYTYDAAKVVTEAIRRHYRQGGVDSDVNRQKILRQLQRMRNAGTILNGATGALVFNEHGTAQKPITIGLFHGGLVSSLVQLVVGTDDAKALKKNIVYSGVQPITLKNVDLITREATAVFDVWFRYQGNIDFSNLAFDSAVTPVDLGKPVEDLSWNGVNYKRYRAEGRFKLNQFDVPEIFEHQMLDIAFFEPRQSVSSLLFVPDSISLPDIGGKKLSDYVMESLTDGAGWKIKNANLYSRLNAVPEQGNPKFLNLSSDDAQRPGILFSGEIGPSGVMLRRNFSSNYIEVIAAILVIATLALRLGPGRQLFSSYPRSSLFAFAALSLGSLVVVEIVLIKHIVDNMGRELIGPLLLTFDTLWWLVPAMLLNLAVSKFIWTPLERMTGQTVPKIVKLFVSGIILILAGFGVIGFVFDQQLTSLLATSGVLAMIIGLAIQMNISNIFSGIALNIEKPFRPGDWVQIGGGPVAKVIDISWRTTKLETFSQTHVVIPNSQAAEARIENFSAPDGMFFIFQTMHFGLGHDPEHVTQLIYDALDTVKSIDGREKLGMTWVKFNGVDERGQKYLLAFDCADRMLKNSQEHVAFIAVVNHLAKEGIHPVTSKLGVDLQQGEGGAAA